MGGFSNFWPNIAIFIYTLSKVALQKPRARFFIVKTSKIGGNGGRGSCKSYKSHI